ncbi:unnamed protein product [Effrenium voratum]|nr:unnamed protein product [Effrenium voratum]
MQHPIVREWVHATSHRNFQDIQKDGVLKGNRCVDDFFDGALVYDEAPKGTWFSANNHHGGLITVTVYPEPEALSTVTGLAFPVSSLLKNDMDEVGDWQLFHVSDVSYGYLEAKYAVAHETDPWFEWLETNLWPMHCNQDEFVALTEDLEWHAVDAREKVLVSVFMVNDDDDTGIPITRCRPYRLRKQNAIQSVSPGRLVR